MHGVLTTAASNTQSAKRRRIWLVAVLAALAITSCGDDGDHAVATQINTTTYRLTDRSSIVLSSNGKRTRESLGGTFQLAASSYQADGRLYAISSIHLSSPSFDVRGASLDDPQACGAKAEGCLQIDDPLNTAFDAIMEIRVNGAEEIEIAGQGPLFSGLRVLTVQLCDVSIARAGSCTAIFAGIQNGYVMTVDAERIR